ncbi:MAG: hypothetical protein PVH68_07840 [Armatimonadota bacterium]|jgi:hypothetical protein
MATTVPLRTAYIYDPADHAAANAQGQNYWYVYIRELMERLGVHADALPPDALGDAAMLSQYGTLFVGPRDVVLLPRRVGTAVEGWVAGGRTLIGFAPDGLDGPFGVTSPEPIGQPEGDFSVSGYAELQKTPLTAPFLADPYLERRLVIMSPLRAVAAGEAEELGRLVGPDGADTGLAAITHRQVGDGHAFYFAFSVPQTLWVMQQGRPVDEDYDGDGYWRMADAMTLRSENLEVAHADALLFLVERMLAELPLPAFSRVPPVEGRVAQAAFYWGGDDEAVPEAQVWASDWMCERGLPYHVNIMPKEGEFALSADEFRHIRSNGHEPSLHFNFMDGFEHPGGFREGDVDEQVRLYREAFGETPTCTVNHWCRWTGWVEPARWMLASGVRADNSRSQRPSPPLNPAGLIGFGFGTAFPYWTYSDHTGRNRRLEFLNEPIVAYELGYKAGTDERDWETVHRAVDMALAHRLTMNMFYHPPNVARHATCRDAIEEILGYLGGRDVPVRHMANDELYRWWRRRGASRLTMQEDTRTERLIFDCEVATHDGIAVTVPLPRGEQPDALLNGAATACEHQELWGRQSVSIVVPRGTHTVEIRGEL